MGQPGAFDGDHGPVDTREEPWLGAPGFPGTPTPTPTPSPPFTYVTNGSSNTVSVIDAASNTVLAIVPVGVNPEGMAARRLP